RTNRSSAEKWRGSAKIRPGGSPKTVPASSNEIPCFARLEAAFLGSHSNGTAVRSTCYHRHPKDLHVTRLFQPIVLCLSLFASANAIYAQTQAALSGTVTDASGGVVVGATVSARNVDTGVAYPAKTGSTGNYTIPTLPPGKYEISCESSGF